jgi:glycosyltransferase involved in cell wall biosynthesis
VRDEIDPALRLVVQPYGLTHERRKALLAGAAPAEMRLAQKTVSFIGMWHARKGAHDWQRILHLIWSRVREARFSFLGTMVEPQTVFSDLGIPPSDRIELVSQFAPADLPALLANCAVGAFPSYIEGFGFAVIEQLAAGIPTVAFDVPGPRDILGRSLPELLIPVGNVDVFADAICRILELDSESYRQLSRRSAIAAAAFDWSHIAGNTIADYRERLTGSDGTIVFGQPFGIGSAGGGARILRALLHDAPVPCTVICTSPEPPPVVNPWHEIHLPPRPYFGRIERTRFRRLPRVVTPIFRRRFISRFERICRSRNAVAIHSIPHCELDFYHARLIAAKIGLPFFLQVHDDFEFSARDQVEAPTAHRTIKSAWQDAAACFVISDRLGREYCSRYGKRDYIVVTDGLESVAPHPVARPTDQLRIYFMGLFHLEYEENLRLLFGALECLQNLRPTLQITVTLRCGTLRQTIRKAAPNMIRVLPFGTELDVERDLLSADLLYLPLPFDENFEAFVRLSLPTKVITYLGTGIPILYHGPKGSAVHELLSHDSAAFSQTSLDADSLAELLQDICDNPGQAAEIAANALQLASRQFMLRDQRAKFWNAFNRVLDQPANRPEMQ